VTSQAAKDRQAEKEAPANLEADREEEKFFAEQRGTVKGAAAAATVVPSTPHKGEAGEQGKSLATPVQESSSPLAPLYVVPNALVYGITFGNVNLFADGENKGDGESTKTNVPVSN